MPMTAYEAGLTPEEREELYRAQSHPTYHRLDPSMVRGAKIRMAAKHPLLALLATPMFSQTKTAMVVIRAFGDELNKIREST